MLGGCSRVSNRIHDNAQSTVAWRTAWQNQKVVSNVFKQRGDHRFRLIERRFEEIDDQIDVWTVNANRNQFDNRPSLRDYAILG